MHISWLLYFANVYINYSIMREPLSDLERAKELKTKVLEVHDRPSLFDSFFSVPWTTADAGFKGLYMLLVYLITVGIGIEALVDLALKGALFESNLLGRFLHEWDNLLFYWCFLCLYSSTYANLFH